jgi:hypothetical protein
MKHKKSKTELESVHDYYFKSIFLFMLGCICFIGFRSGWMQLGFICMIIGFIGVTVFHYWSNEYTRLSPQDLQKIMSLNALDGMYGKLSFEEEEKHKHRWFSAYEGENMIKPLYHLFPLATLHNIVNIDKDKRNTKAIEAFGHIATKKLSSPGVSNSDKEKFRYALMDTFALSPAKAHIINLNYVPLHTLEVWKEHEDIDFITPDGRAKVVSEIIRRSHKA